MQKVDQATLDQLVEDLNKEPNEYVVSKWIVEKIPVIFNGDYETFIKTKLSIANKLGVDSCSIIFVGSSSTGFSLNPEKGFKVFDEESDIDIKNKTITATGPAFIRPHIPSFFYYNSGEPRICSLSVKGVNNSAIFKEHAQCHDSPFNRFRL